MLTLDHRSPLELAHLRAVARRELEVRLAPETARMLDGRREQVVAHVRRLREPAYGFNRGFGHNVNLEVQGGEAQLARLQLNLIRSHAAGVGPPAPARIVRMAMLLRASSLARGHSAVRSRVVETLLALLNANIDPIVPSHGSVSASGDLAPMSHIALALLGEGEVLVDGRRRSAARALQDAGIEPLQLEMKEGLALNNGVQYITAFGIDASERLLDLLRTAAISTSLACQVMLGSASPYRADLHALRPHVGALQVAGWLRELLADSPIQDVHRDTVIDGEVQDPYNLRCAAQILGTCHDLIREARETFAVEANSVTDNPLVLPGGDGAFTDVVSGGHFHGMPVAVKLYNLVQAAAIISSLSHIRCSRFVDEMRNKGLGADLIWPDLSAAQRSTSSGMMAAEYSAAALNNWLWGQSTPSHLFSLSTDCGQEDHVSMGAPLALRLEAMLPRLAEVLAVELAFCAQAAAIRRKQEHFPSKASIPAAAERARKAFVDELERVVSDEEGEPVQVEVSVRKLYPWQPQQRRLSPPGEAVLAVLEQAFPPVTEDRVLSPQLEQIAQLVREGRVLEAARTHVPLL